MSEKKFTAKICAILEQWKQKAIVDGKIEYIDDGCSTLLRIVHCSNTAVPINVDDLDCFSEVDAIEIRETDLAYSKDGRYIWFELMELCSNIKSLSLSAVDLYDHNFPNHLNMRSIETVKLNNISLTGIPELIRRQKNLKNLDISNSRINEIPEEVVCNLECLNVKESQVTSLPDIGKPLGYLKCLITENTGIAEIPACYFPPQVETLLIGQRSITVLPAAIKNLNHIKALRISGTNIEELPDDMCCLDTLEYFDMSFTDITDLPNWISKASKLKHLGLVHLRLTDFSQEIYLSLFRMGDMKFINAEVEWEGYPFNPTIQPGCFLKDTKIRRMDVRYLFTNDRGFLDAFFGAAKVPNHELQIVFCGQTGGNNRRFIHDLIDDNNDDIFSNSLGLQRTEQLAIEDEGRYLLDANAKITYWVLSDDEQYFPAHHLFIGDSALFVVILEAQEREMLQASIIKWITFIEAHTQWSQVLFIIKGIRRDGDLSFFRQLTTITNVRILVDWIGYYYGDNSDSELESGVQRSKLRRKLAELVLEADEYSQNIPVNWLSARRHLRSLLELNGTVTYSLYKEVLSLYAIFNESERRELLMWFGHTGLCFREKGHSKGDFTNMLAPMRVAYAIYSVLELSCRNGGRLTPQELANSLNDNEYFANYYTVSEVNTVLHILVDEGLCIEDGKYYEFPIHMSLPTGDKYKAEALIKWMDSNPLDKYYSTHHEVRFKYLPSAMFSDILCRVFKEYKKLSLDKMSPDDKEGAYFLSKEGGFFSFIANKEQGGGSLYIGGITGVNGVVHIYTSDNKRIVKKGNYSRTELYLCMYASLALLAIKDIAKDMNPYFTYEEYVRIKRSDITAIISLNDIRANVKAGRKELYVPALNSTENVSELDRRYLPPEEKKQIP